MALPIVETARSLRRLQTTAEKVFWEAVRGRRFLGLKFSRQFPITVFIQDEKRHFIADFYCFNHRLIIEIDGPIHDQQKDYDQFRSEVLNDMGFKIVRFSNDELLHDLEKTLKILEFEIRKSPSLEERG